MSGPGNYNQQVIEMFRANKGVVRGPNISSGGTVH